MADKTLDAGNEHCGQLLGLEASAITDLTPGQTLAVATYDPSMQLEVAAWCRTHQHRLLEAKQCDDHVELLIEKAC